VYRGDYPTIGSESFVEVEVGGWGGWGRRDVQVEVRGGEEAGSKATRARAKRVREEARQEERILYTTITNNTGEGGERSECRKGRDRRSVATVHCILL